jgi:hypothetical protein
MLKYFGSYKEYMIGILKNDEDKMKEKIQCEPPCILFLSDIYTPIYIINCNKKKEKVHHKFLFRSKNNIINKSDAVIINIHKQ